LLNKKFNFFHIFYLKKNKDQKLYLYSQNYLKLLGSLKFNLSKKKLRKNTKVHTKNTNETKKFLKNLAKDDFLILKKIENKKFFSAKFLKKIFLKIFDLNKDQIINKEKLDKIIAKKKLFLLDTIKNIPIDPSLSISKKRKLEFLMLFKYIIDLETTKETKEIKFLKSQEILVKRIINRNLKLNTVIPLINEKGVLSFYYVYKTILSKKGMMGYALKSFNDDPPIIAFRGTNFKFRNYRSFFSILDNLRKIIASKGYLEGKEKIKSILNDKNFMNKKIIVAGMSLGGAYAQRLCVDFISKINHLITFNSIGIDDMTIQKFNLSKTKNLKITIIRKQNDIAHFFGDGHLGKNSSEKIKKKLFYLSKTKKDHKFTPSIFSLYKSLIKFHSELFLNENINRVIYSNNHALKYLDNKNNFIWEKWRQNWAFLFSNKR